VEKTGTGGAHKGIYHKELHLEDAAYKRMEDRALPVGTGSRPNQYSPWFKFLYPSSNKKSFLNCFPNRPPFFVSKSSFASDVMIVQVLFKQCLIYGLGTLAAVEVIYEWVSQAYELRVHTSRHRCI
jgi:hypothetical protein